MLEQLDRHYNFCETDCVAIVGALVDSLYRTQDIKPVILDTDYFNITTPTDNCRRLCNFSARYCNFKFRSQR